MPHRLAAVLGLLLLVITRAWAGNLTDGTFTMTLPADWKLKKMASSSCNPRFSADRQMSVAVSPDGGALLGVQCLYADNKATVQVRKQRILEGVHSYGRMDRSQDAVIGGLPALLMYITKESPESGQILWVEVFGSYAEWTIYYDGKSTTAYNGGLPAVQTALKSFRGSDKP